jgi:predicted nuclease with RNAse H fold
MSDICVGVDVSIRRGLDVVVLDAGMQVREASAMVTSAQLGAVLARHGAAVVAIDSPPGPGVHGQRSRAGERELRRLGIQVYATPSDPAAYAKPFYDWVRAGAQAFTAARAAGYPLLDDTSNARGRALEVYPHATDVLLRGCLPPPGTTRRVASKRAWRIETLERIGVDPGRLVLDRNGVPTMDSIDAALAAVTGVLALRGEATSLGDPGEVIVVPGRAPHRLRPHPDS